MYDNEIHASVGAPASQKVSLLHTVGAIPLALITWAIASVLVAAIWYFMNVFFTVIRPEIIGFIANIIGAVIGVTAAKALTDKWLPRYSEKPVAIAFFGFCAFILFTEWALLSNPSHPILVSAAAVATIWTAYYSFWLGEDL